MKSYIPFILLVITINCTFSQSIKKIDIDIYEDSSFEKLENQFNDISFIGVGDATHGTSEFFTFKAELFKYLVKEKNFKTFALEAQPGESALINDFIHGEEYDIDKLINSMEFWAWKTEEMKSLLMWMRSYNSTHKEKVNFIGFDIQLTNTSVDYLYNYIANVDPKELNFVKTTCKNYTPNKRFKYYKVSEEKKLNARKSLVELKKLILKNEVLYTEKSSIHKWRNAYLICVGLLESEKTFTHHPGTDLSSSQRDKSMFEMVTAYSKITKGNKIMLSAHNGHICKDKKYNKVTMGMHLAEFYKSNYLALGTLFGEGDFLAQSMNGGILKKFTVPKTPEGSFLQKLSKNGDSYFFHFENQDESISKLLMSSQSVYDIPANFKYDESFYFKPFILSKHYDGIMFFNKTKSITKLK